MPLINCKIHLELNWTKHCVTSNIGGNTTFKILNTKLNVPIVTLCTEDNVKLTKQLSEGFKKFVYWNQYKTEINSREQDNNNNLGVLLDASFQGVKKLFVNAFEKKIYRKYFLPIVNKTSYNVLIDSRNFYDQPIGDQIKTYNEIRKIATGRGNDYTTGCLLDY